MSPSEVEPDRLSPLISCLKMLSEGPPVRARLGEILDGFARALDCERIFLFRIRVRGGFHVLLARSRDGEDIPRPGERMSHHAVRRMASSGKVLHVPDARQDRRYRPEEAADGKRMAHSILVIPLSLRGELYGGVYADHRFQGVEFPGDEILQAWVSLLRVALLLREDATAARRVRREAGAGISGAVRRDPRSRKPIAFFPVEAPDEPVLEEFHGFLSANPDIKDLFDMVRSLGPSDLPVLIQGETGTGKGLLARALHESSVRREKPFVTLHAGTVPESLFESELLGHVKGAFTGAESAYDGVFVRSDGGTLFLDEVADMSLEVQKKLLRVLEDGRVRALGAKEPIDVDVRLVAATSRDLERLVRQGRFRRDLFFRMKGAVLSVPPLRDRREDIAPLARCFLERHAGRAGKACPRLAPSAVSRLVRYGWPGNVREIENEMRKVVALGQEVVEARSLSPSLLGRATPGGPPGERETFAWRLEETVELAEKEAIIGALRIARGNKSRAAKQLGITRKSLYRRMAKYAIGEEE